MLRGPRGAAALDVDGWARRVLPCMDRTGDIPLSSRKGFRTGEYRWRGGGGPALALSGLGIRGFFGSGGAEVFQAGMSDEYTLDAMDCISRLLSPRL